MKKICQWTNYTHQLLSDCSIQVMVNNFWLQEQAVLRVGRPETFQAEGKIQRDREGRVELGYTERRYVLGMGPVWAEAYLDGNGKISGTRLEDSSQSASPPGLVD